MKKVTLIILITIACFKADSQNQGVNNWWIMGYEGFYGALPFGNTFIDFNSGIPVLSHTYLEMEFRHTHANISDAQGNLLFYTNGYYIADATHDTMMNGSGINPSSYTSYFSDGLGIPQANIILPIPGSSNLYAFIHSTADKYPGYTCSYNLYYSVIDMNLNGGLGSVTIKNQIILTDSLNYGKITAVKHANGRDWWIICHRIRSSLFYKFLLTPFTLQGPYLQNIGNNDRRTGAGQAVFSPDGKRYAHFWMSSGTQIGNLEIFNFSRCTGLLDSVTQIFLNYENGYQVGVAFSPNSNVLYVSNVFHVYQFDLTAANIPASMDTVATYDGFLDSYPPWPALPTLFALTALAPDGKIYITTGNSTHYFHSIDNPDVIGTGCNVNQHSIQLPAYYFNTLPNHPNYFLGCDTTCTPCLEGLTPGPSPKERGVTANPNPNNGAFTLQFDVQSTAGELLIYDVNGRMVYKDYIAPWSQFKRVDMRVTSPVGRPGGVYLCMLKWGESSVAVKVIIQDE
jgi:hypothetical protein